MLRFLRITLFPSWKKISVGTNLTRRFRLGWLCLWFVVWGWSWTGCPSPAWLDTLRPPTGPVRQQIRWMRTTFYQAYLEERKQLDGADRLRRLIQKFPQLALQTYQLNEKAVEDRRLSGQLLQDLEKFYLLMNRLIQESIPVPTSPPKPSEK